MAEKYGACSNLDEDSVSNTDNQNALGEMSVPNWNGGTSKEKHNLREEIERILKELCKTHCKSAGFFLSQIGGWAFSHYIKCFLHSINIFYTALSEKNSVECLLLFFDDGELYQKANQITNTFLQNGIKMSPGKQKITWTYPNNKILVLLNDATCDADVVIIPSSDLVPNISIEKQLLIEAQTETLVSTISSDLNLKNSSIPTSILDKAGARLQKEIKNKWKSSTPLGAVLKTGACGIPPPCKAIFFGVLKSYNSQDDSVLKFQHFVSECLKQASISKYKSIAFPAIGTGNLGYPIDKVADVMLTAVMEFKKSMPKMTLKEIKFVIHPNDAEAYQVFQDKIQCLKPGQKGGSKGSLAVKTVLQAPTKEKCCFIVNGNINDRKDLERRFNQQLMPMRIVCPFEKKSALLIFEHKVDVKTLLFALKPLKVVQIQPEEVTYPVPDGLVERLCTTEQDKRNLFANLQNISGVDFAIQDNKPYLIGLTSHQLDIAKHFLKEYEENLMAMRKKQNRSSDSIDEEWDNQISKINNVSEVEFKALMIVAHDIEKIKLSWCDGAILIERPPTDVSVDKYINSQLATLRRKQSVEIALDEEEKRIVNDVIMGTQSKDTVCVYDENKNLVVLYSDVQENIMTFKHKLKFLTGKLKQSTRSSKRFSENTQVSENFEENFKSPIRSKKIGQDCLRSKHSLDNAEYQAEDNVIKKSSQNRFHSPARPKETGDDYARSKVGEAREVFYTKENIKIAVYMADILNLDVDCIVNAANDRMQHGGGVARVIADAAGSRLVQEGNAIIRQHGQIPVGQQVTTSAGNLPYKCVIHTVGPCWSDYYPHDINKVQDCERHLYAAIYGCFTEAERNGIYTIALPAVSSGIYAVPQEMCAVQYARAVIDYSRNSRHEKALKEIHFIDKLPHLVTLMQDKFRTMIQNGKEPNYNIQNYVASSSDRQRIHFETGRKGHATYWDETGRKGHATHWDETGRKGHAKHWDETGRKGHATHWNETGIKGHAKHWDGTERKGHSKHWDESERKGHSKHWDESERKGHHKEFAALRNSQQENIKFKRLHPVYYEQKNSDKREFVFQVSAKPVIYIYEGDICKLKHVDALVCPEDPRGSGMGKIASELSKDTKYRQFKDKCFKQQNPSAGDLVIISGEGTCPNCIAHVIINNHSQTQELRSVIDMAFGNILLMMNERIGVKSIALPLFGLKRKILTEKWWAESFLEKFVTFCCEVDNPNLEEVHIITQFDSSSTYSILTKVFIEFSDKLNHEQGIPPIPASAEPDSSYQDTDDPMSEHEDKSANIEGYTDDCCTICMCSKTDPEYLSCGHSFCSECITQMFKHKPVCAVCGRIVGILTGDQPNNGSMSVKTSSMDLAGYNGHGSLEITYDFSAGKQGPDHPSPGKWYGSMTRTAYLPNTKEGRNVCRMLQLAFDRRLVFTISQSRTTGKEGLTWNDIHHKTNPTPGLQFGYPDPEYLTRVKDELSAKGITEADLPPE